MGFWFFGPVTWSWGGEKGKRPRGRVMVFGAFLSFPLAAWNVYQAATAKPEVPANPEFDVIQEPSGLEAGTRSWSRERESKRRTR